MGTIDYTARPRFYALDADYKIEVDYVAASGVRPAHIAPLDVTDDTGESVDNDDLFTLARDLCEYDGDDVEDALEVLLGYALERDRAERNVALADEADVDEAIPFSLTDAASDALDELVEWQPDEDPERPEPWRMDDEGVNAFAREGTTGRVLRALDRAAGGAR